MIEKTIGVDRMEHVISVFGSFDQNLRIIESELEVSVVERGDQIHISGEAENVMLAEEAINGLLTLAAKGENIDAQNVRYILKLVREGKQDKIGELAGAMKEAILRNGLREKVIPVGNQQNPYRFMGNCDCYVQFSRYEADPLTVKEAAALGKPMALTDIPPFRDCSRDLRNVTLFNGEEEAAEAIRKIRGMTIEETDPQTINRKARRGIDALLHAEPAGSGQKAGTPANDREENAR